MINIEEIEINDIVPYTNVSDLIEWQNVTKTTFIGEYINNTSGETLEVITANKITIYSLFTELYEPKYGESILIIYVWNKTKTFLCRGDWLVLINESQF